MSFQRRPPQSAPACPWCDQPMMPCPGSQQGRLCCPTGDPVEYRTRGGRWYFSGRLLGLEESMPEPPEPPDAEEADAEEADEPPPASGPDAVASDALDAFRKVAGAAWEDDEGTRV